MHEILKAQNTNHLLAVLISLALAALIWYIYRSLEIEREILSEARIFNPKVHSDVLFGHVHMAKTAGTTLNGELAARFERVCGHKGYSYDSWRVNYRLNRSRSGEEVPGDSFSKIHKGYNRSRVHASIMTEIGYEDCDYVSHETGWQFWPNTFQGWCVPLELHIPCRDPISHLMSMCNYQHKKFNCTNDLEIEIRECLLEMNRFSIKLTTDYENINAKCFQAQQISEYIDFISRKLQPKRVPAQYIFWATNAPRSEDNECIWKNNTALSFVRKYMGAMEYYKYCASCLGSNNDILQKA
jgi:hypothetical protein